MSDELLEPPPLPPGNTPYDESAPPPLPERGPVTALRVVGQNVQLDLPEAQDRFTLGAAPRPAVDLTLEGAQVSRLHLVLVRKGAKLTVLDQNSTNGTFYRGHRDPDFEIVAGDIFEVSRRITLLALDERLEILRRRLLWVLGLRNHAAADRAIQTIASNEPLLLEGPANCEQLALAQEIHRRSPYNDRALVIAPARFETREVQNELLDRAIRSTMYIDLTEAAAPLPNHFVASAFARSRVIVAAASEDSARELLDTYAGRLQPIRLATPAERGDDVPRLLEALVIQEHERLLRDQTRPPPGELLPIAAIGEENIAALKRQPWPGHFADLRRQVPRFHALLTNRLGLRATARALGLKSVSSLIDALHRIEVHIKVSDDDETPREISDDDDPPTPPGTPTR